MNPMMMALMMGGDDDMFEMDELDEDGGLFNLMAMFPNMFSNQALSKTLLRGCD